jgi:PAS domain S-box-containing protein
MGTDPIAPNPPPAPSDTHSAERIAALEQQLAQQAAQLEALQNRQRVLQAVLDHVPYAIYWKDRDLVYQGCNRRFADDLALDQPEEIIGKQDTDLPWQPSEAAAFQQADRQLMESRQPSYDDNETVEHPDGSQEWFETYKFPLTDRQGNLLGVVATYHNITARKIAEATINGQAELLRELSTPIIPLTERIMVVPLIGAIDTKRAHQLITTVLEQLSMSHSELIFLDITGVPLIDTHVALAILQTGKAVQLLGAKLIITGIRPEVAHSLVGLGVDLQGIVTYSTLQSGLAAMGVLRR